MAAISSSIWMNFPPTRAGGPTDAPRSPRRGKWIPREEPAAGRDGRLGARLVSLEEPDVADLVWVLTLLRLLRPAIPRGIEGPVTQIGRIAYPLVCPARRIRRWQSQGRAARTAGTWCRPPALDLHLVHAVHPQDILRAEFHTDGASLTPGIVDLDRHARADVRLGRRPGDLQHLVADRSFVMVAISVSPSLGAIDSPIQATGAPVDPKAA